MERRRVQEVGGGTVTVSLPAPWAAEHDVAAGTEVLLSPHQDGSLVVRLTEPHDGVFGTRELDIEDPDTVPDLLRAAFGAGYKRIVLRRSAAFTEEKRQSVVETVRSLAGIDIVEESEQAIVIAELLSVEDFSIRQTLLQLRYAVGSMHERTLGLLEDGAGTVEPIVDRQEEIDRQVWNVDRIFTRALNDPETMDALGEPRHKLYHYTRIAHLHGRAGKLLLNLAETLTHPETTISHRDRLRPLLVDAGRAFENGIEAALNEVATETALVAIEAGADVRDRQSNVRSELAAETTGNQQFAVLELITGLATVGQKIADIALQVTIATQDIPQISTRGNDDSEADERPASTGNAVDVSNNGEHQ
jgi:phosphate uptake regulator